MGLMDMFSVRDIRSFGTGFLGAKVEAMQESARVAAEEKKFKDELKAKRISSVQEYEDKSEIDANVEAEKLAHIINGNKNFLISYLKVTPDYIDKIVPAYVLEDNQSTWAWLDDQAKKWGIPDWSTRKMNYTPDGKENPNLTIPQWQLSTHISSNFNKSNAVDSLKKGANIPDNSADLITNNTKDKKTVNYNGIEVWNGKPSLGYSTPIKMIHQETGAITDAFQREQTSGQKDYTPHLWTLTFDDDNKSIIGLLQDRNEWHEVTSPKGESLMHDFYPDLDKENVKKWMLYKDNQWWSIDGREDVYKDGSSDIFITGGDPNILNALGLEAYYNEPPPGAEKIPNYWEIPKREFDLALREGNLYLQDYDSQTVFDSKKLPKIDKYSVGDYNRIIEGSLQSAGYILDKDYQSFSINSINQTVDMSMLGDTSERPAASAFATTVLDGVINLGTLQNEIASRGKGANIDDLLLSDEIVEALQLSTNNPYDIDAMDYAFKMGTFYKTIRKDLGTNYLTALDSFGENQETRNSFLSDNRIDKEFWGESNDQLAQRMAQNILSDRTTFTGLFNLRKQIDSAVAGKVEAKVEADRQIVDTYFPPNVATLSEFVDEYITDYSGGNITQKQMGDLAFAVAKLTGGNEEHIDILDDAIDEYLKTKDVSDTTDDKSKFEIRTEEKLISEKEEADLFANTNMPPDYRAASPGAEWLTGFFESEGQKDMLIKNEKLWVKNNAENWNKIIAQADKEKPKITHTMSEPTVGAKIKPKKIETEDYKLWKAKYWEYIKSDDLAQELIKKHTIQQ